MADDSIKYRDLIEPDDSIERLIKQMEELTSVFGQATSSIKGGASEVSKSLKGMSGATAEGRKELDVAAVAAERLAKAQFELKVAHHELGVATAQVKARIAEVNKASAEQMRQMEALGTSYNAIKSRLGGYIAQYRSLSKEERENEAVSGSLVAVITRLKDELREADNQIKLHVKELTLTEKMTKLLANSEAKLAQARHEASVLIQQNNLLTQEANRLAKLQAVVNTSAEGSYKRLSAQYEINKIKLNNMSLAQRENTEEGKKLVAGTYNIYQQMIKLQEATGKYSLNVGNYGKAWNGLNFAVQQTVRELPALAVGFQTFFLGISNNLPYVIDEINALRKASKGTSSVIKGLLGSIFNWQTALIVLITVLSACGDEIFDWAASLFGAKAKVMSLTKAIKNINKELESTNASYGENVVKLKHLQDEWKKLKTTAEKAKWIKDNKSEFSSLYLEIDNINDAEKTFVTQTGKVITGFEARARAAAANKLAAEKYEEAMRLELKAANLQTEWDETDTSTFSGALKRIGQMTGALFGESPDEIKARAEALKVEGDQYFRLAEGYDKARGGGYDKARGGGGKGKGRKGRDMTDYIANMDISVRKKYETALTALEKEEYAKRAREATKRYQVEVDELEKTYAKNERILNDEENLYKDLTAEQIEVIKNAQETIKKTITERQLQLTDELIEIEKDRQIAELKTSQQTLQLKLDAIDQEGRAELDLRRQILQKQREIALAENAKLPPSQRQKESDINASFDKQDKLLAGEFAMSYFDEYQALQEAQFNAVKQNERDITRFKLTQERERWQQQIALAEAGGLDWSTAQIEAARAAVDGINRKLNDLDNFAKRVAENGLGVTLLQMMGLDDDQVNAAVEYANIMIEQIQAIMDAEVKAAEQAVALAQERVDAAQSAVDAEVEARKNGYANSVAVAKAELEMEKRNQKQKEKQLKQAQIAQEAINSVTQAGSLITASANLWASFSPIPIVGPALAIAAMATMWGSFAYAKIRAAQLTSKYGEGGLEFLEGGSHAMGNDIDLGVSNSKNRRMKAEGGEALAIINKRNSRKYRKVLPDVIDSFNRGTFEQKYLNAFDTGGQPIFVTNQSNNIDLSRIEADIRAIKDRNSTQVYTMPDGSVIIQKKNVKRIIHQ